MIRNWETKTVCVCVSVCERNRMRESTSVYMCVYEGWISWDFKLIVKKQFKSGLYPFPIISYFAVTIGTFMLIESIIYYFISKNDYENIFLFKLINNYS